MTLRARPAPASTTSTSGSAASPRSPTCSAACWAARSTTSSRTSWRSCRTATGFYYLARTPGLNLRTQLEGNSFAELIERNTDGTNTLKADAFATADCKFQLANLAGTPAGFASFGATVADDPTTTDCDESKLLLRKPDGTIQYRAVNTVDPSGVNGQSVYNGNARSRPHLRRQRQRHLLGWRRQRHHRRQRRRRRRSRWRRQRHHHRPRRRRRPQGRSRQRRHRRRPGQRHRPRWRRSGLPERRSQRQRDLRRSRQRLHHRRPGRRRRVR